MSEVGLARRLDSKERTLLLAMLGDVVWTLLALASAWMANSVALWANTSRVGMETLLSVLAFVGVYKLARSGRSRFDYGLGKLESIFSLLGGVVFLLTFILVGWQALERLLAPQPTHGTGLGIAVLFLVSFYNCGFYLRLRRLLKQEHSPILHTQTMLYRNALAASSVTFLCMLLPALFPDAEGLYYLDPLGALMLCGFIFQSALTLIRDSLFQLLDGTLEESMQMAIMRTLAAHFDDYQQLHDIRSRRSGSQVFVEIFLEFPPQQTHQDVLGRCAQIKHSLEAEIPAAVVWVVPVGGALPYRRLAHAV